MGLPVVSNLSEEERKHEEFKSRLVDDVFGKDNQGKVQMEKVTMLIWHFRDDPSVVGFMAQFVAKFAGSRDVFDGIEFYLPQLAHMIIHLEVDWDDAILERFALIIAQQSLHFALQLNWILVGAIEDYQPETTSGEPNPSYNPLFYSRCVKLLTNIERCVVYGKPRSHELQRLYERGKISKKEYEILEQADRRFNAVQITALSNAPSDTPLFGGDLLYKRAVRRSCFKKKPWKMRYFCIEERMLYCYSNKESKKLVRAMPLEGAVVEEEQGKYPHMFQVSNRNFHFRMRAKNAEDKELWMKTLKEESEAHAIFAPSSQDNDSEKKAKNNNKKRVMEDLTPTQRRRYDFFTDERDFVRNMCDVAERLRFNTPSERKKLAAGYVQEMPIPPCCYVPLCNSTDIWRRVDTDLDKDTRVFNTKERCPTIVYFVTKRGERLHHHRGGIKDVNLDVAEYMHLQYEVPDEMEQTVEVKENNGLSAVDETPSQASEGPAEKSEDDGKFVPASIETLDQDSVMSSVSTVWIGDTHDSSPMKDPHTKGNRQFQSFLRDNVVKAPSKIFNRIESRRRSSVARMSMRGRTQLPLQSVPILENRSYDEADTNSATGDRIVSVTRSSILSHSGIILGDAEEGDIDHASVERAKEIICHGESYAEKTARMLGEVNSGANDENGGVQTEIVTVMAKSNDDLRQEVFVMQMIHYYKSVFAKAHLPLWLKTYRILSTSKDTGLIEVLTDATSIDGLKKSEGYPKEGGLRAYFEQIYGKPEGKSFKAAQTNFMQSLVAYSLVSYLLGLKDRHNGNIMIDTRGHLIFIDFGFAMGMAPGHEFSMERAPFKLTKEYVEVMGGPDSDCFGEFKRLFVAGFEEARKNSQIGLGLVEIMMYKSNYPCFTGARYGHGRALKGFEKRLMLGTPDERVEKNALQLITRSNEHTGTYLYDVFQHKTNGYAI